MTGITLLHVPLVTERESKTNNTEKHCGVNQIANDFEEMGFIRKQEIEMKIAIYVEDGDKQIILTHEDKFEKAVFDQIMDYFENEAMEAQIFRGSFYQCQGGYWRQGTGDDSLMIRMRRKK